MSSKPEPQPRPGDRVEIYRGTTFYEGPTVGQRGKLVAVTPAGPWAKVRLEDGRVALVAPGNLRRVET